MSSAGSDTGAAIVWFRRDLRLADNPALTAACEHAGEVVALYVHAPQEAGEWQPGAASLWWLHHSLIRLDASLRTRGGSLCIRAGGSLETLLDVARETGARQVFWNRIYDPLLVARDTQIKSALGEAGLHCESFNAALLHEPWQVRTVAGDPYRVFTPYWRNCAARLDSLPPPLPPPTKVPAPAAPPRSVDIAALGLRPRLPWDTGLQTAWTPGEEAALDRLEAFAGDGVADYPDGRNRPDRSDTSRLSPHLHFGELGPRQCVAALHNAIDEHRGNRGAAEGFIRQLGWREFAHHLLHHYPHTVTQPLDERFTQYPWTEDAGWLAAWQQGRTGYPIVDAGMRELWSTGWMHNRVRMIVASFLTKNLRQHWLEGARWFWDTLVDADLANNTLGWQWTAGCGADAAPYFRIFNPMLQSDRYDPDRGYLRRWLPELASLPDRYLPRPWEAPPQVLAASGIVPGQTYPRPIVDFGESRQAALDGYARIRDPGSRG